MSYTPTQWQTGDTVTAEKLNKIENGIEAANGSNEFIIKFIVDDSTNIVCDKSYSEIREATENGMKIVPILIFENNVIMNATNVAVNQDGLIYGANFLMLVDEMIFHLTCKYEGGSWRVEYKIFTLTEVNMS